MTDQMNTNLPAITSSSNRKNRRSEKAIGRVVRLHIGFSSCNEGPPTSHSTDLRPSGHEPGKAVEVNELCNALPRNVRILQSFVDSLLQL